MQRFADALLLVILVAQAWFLLELHVPIAGHDIDAPIADIAACGLIALLPVQVYVRTRPGARPAMPDVPGLAPYAVLLGAMVLSSALFDPEISHQSRFGALHWILRKPFFEFVAYAVAMPVFLTEWPRERFRNVMLAAIGLTATLSVTTSAIRILGGSALDWAAIEGITNNHKTLAVWLAPFVPWLIHEARERVPARVVLALASVGILLAASKSAWLVAAFGVAFAVHVDGRPILARWRAGLVAGLVAMALLLTSPRWLGNADMADALDARDAIDRRQAAMWMGSPWTGQGPGSSVTWEITTPPDWRVNGIDAHGVIQKVGGEVGTLGLLAWGAFTISLGAALYKRWDGDTRSEGWAWLGVAAGLHVALIQSTESFHLTHWVPLGIVISRLKPRESA